MPCVPALSPARSDLGENVVDGLWGLDHGASRLLQAPDRDGMPTVHDTVS